MMEMLELATDLKGCRDALDRCKAICDETSRLWDADVQARDATIEKLREYARHHANCTQFNPGDITKLRCDCGYDALMADLGEGK